GAPAMAADASRSPRLSGSRRPANTFQPRVASSVAVSSPNPRDQPVTRTFRFATCFRASGIEPLQEVVAEVADEVADHVALDESPLAFDALEPVAVPPRVDGLDGELL